MHRNTATLERRRERAQSLRDSLRQTRENADAEIESARATERLVAKRSVRREAMHFRHALNSMGDHSRQGRRHVAAELDESSKSPPAAWSHRPQLAHSDYIAQTVEHRLSAKNQRRANIDDGTNLFSTLAKPTLVSTGRGAESGAGRSDGSAKDMARHNFSAAQTTDPREYFALLLQSEGGVQVKDEHALHSAHTFQDAVGDASEKTKRAVFTRQAVIAEVEAALRMHARLLQQLEQRVQRRQQLHDSVLRAADARRADAAQVDAAAYGSLPRHKWPVSAQRRATLPSVPSFGEDISVIAGGDSDGESVGSVGGGGGGGVTAPWEGSREEPSDALDTAASMRSILSYSGRAIPPVGGEALREAMSKGGMFHSSTAERVRASGLQTHDMRGMAMADPVLREWLLQRYAQFKWEEFKARDDAARLAAAEGAETASRLPERSTARAVQRVDPVASPAVLPPGAGGGSPGGAIVAAATDAFDAGRRTAEVDSDSDSSGADTPRGGVAALAPSAHAPVPVLDIGAAEAGAVAAAAAAPATAAQSLAELETVLGVYRAHLAGGRAAAPGTTLGALAHLQDASSAARLKRGRKYSGTPGAHMRPSCRVDEDSGLPVQRPRIPLIPSNASLQLLASASTAAEQLPLVPPLPLYPPAGDASSNAAAAMTAATVQRALHTRAAPGSARGRLQGRALRGVPQAVAADRPAWPSTSASQEALQTATSLTGTSKDMVPTHRNTGTLPASVTKALTHDCRLEVAWRDAGNFGAAWSARRGKAMRQRQERSARAAVTREAAAAVQALDDFGARQVALAPADAAAAARAHALQRPGEAFPGVWADASVQDSSSGTPTRRRGALAAAAAGMMDSRAGASRVYCAAGPQWSHSIHLHRHKGAPSEHCAAALGCAVTSRPHETEGKADSR